MPEVHAHPALSVVGEASPKLAIVCHSHPSVTKGGGEAA